MSHSAAPREHEFTAAHAAAAQQLAAMVALEEMRVRFDGTIVLLKGLELACRYPDPSRRASGDIDVLTDEPERLQATLLANGYRQIDLATSDLHFYDDHHHHLVPVQRAGLPAVVEVHRSLGWLAGMTPPSLHQLMTHLTPSAAGIEGVAALEPAAHAVYLAVHSWRHRPFNQRRDLDDIALLLGGSTATILAADQLAAEWGVRRIWSLYQNAIAAAAGDERPRLLVRIFGGDPAAGGSRSPFGQPTTMFELLVLVVAPFFVDRPLRSLPAIARTLKVRFEPQPGETTWGKARRIARRLRHST